MRAISKRGYSVEGESTGWRKNVEAYLPAIELFLRRNNNGRHVCFKALLAVASRGLRLDVELDHGKSFWG